MQTTSIHQEIRGFLVETFLFGRTEELTDDAPLLDTVIDSHGVVEFVVFLQDHFEQNRGLRSQQAGNSRGGDRLGLAIGLAVINCTVRHSSLTIPRHRLSVRGRDITRRGAS
jgi:hypothetical protein